MYRVRGERDIAKHPNSRTEIRLGSRIFRVSEFLYIAATSLNLIFVYN